MLLHDDIATERKAGNSENRVAVCPGASGRTVCFRPGPCVCIQCIYHDREPTWRRRRRLRQCAGWSSPTATAARRRSASARSRESRKRPQRRLLLLTPPSEICPPYPPPRINAKTESPPPSVGHQKANLLSRGTTLPLPGPESCTLSHKVPKNGARRARARSLHRADV
jgi:hypothetical protein